MTDISFVAESVRDSVLRFEDAVFAATAPHVRMRASVFPDGNKWCCLYGEDLMQGVAGFGDTPQLACWDFDRAWHNERTPVASADTLPQGQDAQQGLAGTESGAVPEGQTPSPHPVQQQEDKV